MNQEKIGKFISKERRNKNLTQKELADKLNISEKTISKWECGKGLPEISLMQPLCKEIDITITELLNGEKSPKEDKAIVDYFKYEKKRSKKRITLFIITSILLITFILSTITYYINNYGKIVIYELSGESENFSYTNGMFIKSNTKNILSSGELIVKNSEKISESNIISVILKSDNQIIIGGNTYLSIEDNGYNEIFTKEKINNINNWYLEITYEDDDTIKTEKIKLNNKVILKNTNYFNKVIQSISSEKNTNKTEKETTNKSLAEIKSKLISKDYVQKSSTILKKEVKNMTITVDIANNFVRVNTNNEYKADGFDIKYNSEKYPENNIYYTKKYNGTTEVMLYDVASKKITCLSSNCTNDSKYECEKFYKFVEEQVLNVDQN